MSETRTHPLPPLIDDITVKDLLADTCAGVSIVGGNAHITFASITADHTINPAPSRRIVSARIVMPLPGMIELRDILNRLVEQLRSNADRSSTEVNRSSASA
jgi:hypothetical protein